MHRTDAPKYRRQKSGKQDRAFVELGGARFYLGAFNSAESKEKYHRLLAEWEACGAKPKTDDGLSVMELCARFLKHAEVYYIQADGNASSELTCYKSAMAILRTLYGRTEANTFGPLALKAVRSEMIKKEWCRTTVNRQIGRIRHIFRWGVQEEIVPAQVYQALIAVEGLKRGRTEAPETDPVRPVLDAHIEAVRPFVSRQVWSLIQLQLMRMLLCMNACT